MPPLAGVFHLAGTLDDGALIEQTWDRFESVMRPKVAGAWNLHEQTSELPLDAFVLFSSVTSIFGNAGQSNYAAANAFLDALAHLRRSQGLPALSINWGPWAEAGMTARLSPRVDHRNRKFGIGSIAGPEGMELLARLQQHDGVQVAILPIDWRTFVDACNGNVPPVFSAVCVAAPASMPSGAASRDRAPELLTRLGNANRDDRDRVVLEYVQAQIMNVLGLDASFQLRPHQGLHDLGLDSLMALELRNRLQAAIGQPLPATLAFDCPTLETLSSRLMEKLGKAAKAVSTDVRSITGEPIAIVGMGCRLPGSASNPDAFWAALRDGFDAVVEVPGDRWDIDAFYDPARDAAGKMYTRHGAFLDQVDRFDPQFFGIAPREAVSLDPQHRLLLEVTWEALEHAGMPPDALLGTKTGVFVGICSSDYGHLQLMAGEAPDAYFGTGNALSAAAGRLSYVLGLQGPSLSVDTACSSSLVAVHLACQSLRRGECRVALAGGVNLMLAPNLSEPLSCADAVARRSLQDVRCRGRRLRARRRLRHRRARSGCRDALADGDRVLAVIRGLRDQPGRPQQRPHRAERTGAAGGCCRTRWPMRGVSARR